MTFISAFFSSSGIESTSLNCLSSAVEQHTSSSYLIYFQYWKNRQYTSERRVSVKPASEPFYLGYVYIYVANETQADFNVFFDDVEIAHNYNPIVQARSYYPFGETFLAYTRALSKPNRYLYQGKEAQEETETYDFHARGYNPILGRTWQQDPHAENYYSWSSYSWAADNRITFIDPTGMDVISIAGGISITGDDITTGLLSQISSALGSGSGGKESAHGDPETPADDPDPAKKDSYNALVNNKFDVDQSGGSDGSSNDYYNAGLVTGLNAANIVRGNFEFGGAVAYQELTKGGNAVRLADKAKYTGLVKYGKVVGRAGYGLTAGVAIYEVATGTDNTHTWVDVGVTALGVGAVAVFGTVAAPVVAVGAIGYGVWSIAGGSDWIDSNWGYRPVNEGSK